MHPEIIARIASQHQSQCPCGAVAEHPYGLCRKCRARMEWRRRNTKPTRRLARRRSGRLARDHARNMAFPSALFGSTTGEDTQS